MTYPPRPGDWPDQPAGGWPAGDQPAGYTAWYPYPGYPVLVPARRTSGMSIAAMVVSIVAVISFPCYGVPGIALGLIGAILGHVGLRQTKERGEAGGGMAVAGIALGWIAVGLGVIASVFYLFVVVWVQRNANTFPTPAYS